MKIKHETLKNIKITTQYGPFAIDKDGVVDVPNEVADALIQDGLFSQVEIAPTKKETKDTKEAAPKESK